MKISNVISVAAAVLANIIAHSTGNAAIFPSLFDSTWVGFNLGNYQTARYPWDAVMADFNADGKPDLAAAQGTFSSGFSVVLNDGNGGFEQQAITIH